MLKNMTLKRKLIVLALIPLLLMSVAVFSALLITNKISKSLQTTLKDESLISTELILNADRDFYQALVALYDKNTESYEENTSQVSDRTNKANISLSKNYDKWNKYVHKNSGKTVFTEFSSFEKNYNEWKKLADVVIYGKGKVAVQEENFDLARNNLDVITGLIEQGTTQELLNIERNKKIMYGAIFIFSLVSFIFCSSFAWLIVKSITNPLSYLNDKAEEIAGGNLTIQKLDITSKDEIGLLGESFNKMLDNLRELIKNTVQSAEEISASSQQMSASSEQTAQGAQQVATSVSQLASGSQEQANDVNRSLENINDVNRAIQNISASAQRTVEMSTSAEQKADDGKNQADEAVQKINQIKTTATEVSGTINQLGKLSSEIEQIVDLIKTIASQTNLLALNAAIEAARAGEHGKGFAVVAEEVKKLAGQSADATDKITGMIKEIQNKTNTAVVTMEEAVQEVGDGVGIVENTGKSLEEILAGAKLTSEEVHGIAKEVDNVAKNAESIVKMMENVASIIEESSASAEEISSISEEQSASTQQINASAQAMAKIAENLQKQVSVFQV